MWKFREARKMIKNLRGIQNLSQGIGSLAQQRVNSSRSFLESIQEQFQITSAFVKKVGKKEEKVRILLVDQELFGPERVFQGDYDHLFGASGAEKKNYLGPLECPEQFLNTINRKFSNQEIEFIIPGGGMLMKSPEVKKYHRSFFKNQKELMNYHRRLELLWVFYSQRFLENQYRYKLMSGAKKNAKKLAEKYSAIAKNEMIKASSEQLIINSVIMGEK
jgi:hypothetical protein